MNNDTHAFDTWFLRVIGGVLVAGVIALWSMNATVSRLEERISNWTKIYDKRFDIAEVRLGRAEQDRQKIRELLQQIREHQSGR